jgi:hypothetical protein
MRFDAGSRVNLWANTEYRPTALNADYASWFRANGWEVSISIIELCIVIIVIEPQIIVAWKVMKIWTADAMGEREDNEFVSLNLQVCSSSIRHHQLFDLAIGGVMPPNISLLLVFEPLASHACRTCASVSPGHVTRPNLFQLLSWC